MSEAYRICPGGIVVIRFAKDQAERKLVADLAPITKK